MRKLINSLVIIFFTIFGLALIWAILELPPPHIYLPEQVFSKLKESGAAHPVTAVLLNFRGYDTLLEVAVLLLALLCVLAQAKDEQQKDIVAGKFTAYSDLQILQWLAGILTPVMILVSGYLLWAGAHQPGGAFQAAAVLAGAGVLLKLADLLPDWNISSKILRGILVAGLLIFLLVAVIGMVISPSGQLLQYPPALAGALILLIEAGLTFSLGLILTGLFLSLYKDTSVKETEE